MAMEIFRLIGSVFVDTDKADESINKTDKKAMDLGQTFIDGVGTAAKWGAAIVTGATAAAGALVGVATDAAGAMDVIDKGSAKIGISKTAYQEWSYVLGQNGMDISKMEVGMKTLVATMDGAAAGTASAVEKFDALGLSIYDSNGKLKDQETMMSEAIYALANMENGTEKARLATELFGKSGVEMMPMLNGGAEGIADLTQRAHDLGLVMSDEAVTAGVVLGDTMDDVKQSFGALGNQLGVSFMPIIQSVLDLILANLPTIQDMFSKLAPVLVGLLEGVLPSLFSLSESLLPIIFYLLGATIPLVVDIVDALLPVFVSLIEMLLPPIVEIVKNLLPPLLQLLMPILDLLNPILSLLQPILDLVVGILAPLAELISGLLTPLVSIISKVIEVALIPLQAQFTTLSGILSNTVKAAIDMIMVRVEAIKGVFSGLIQFVKGVFTGDWKQAWEGVQKIFNSVFEGLKNSFKIPINWIIDGINSFIKGLNKLKIPDWVPGVGGMGLSLSTIPRLYEGAVLEKGQTGFLEGNGAEAVVPLHNNKKWISAVSQDMAENGIGGMASNELLDAFLAFVAALPDILRDAFGNTKLSVNNREFARLVKAVE